MICKNSIVNTFQQSSTNQKSKLAIQRFIESHVSNFFQIFFSVM
jgi:hypothetical protein